MAIKAKLTQSVKRPIEQIDRQVDFQNWLSKIKSNFYAQHGRVVDACSRIN